jgi:hypothetical protein
VGMSYYVSISQAQGGGFRPQEPPFDPQLVRV